MIATPTPVPPRIVLVAPAAPADDLHLTDQARAALEGIAAASGIGVSTVDSLPTDDASSIALLVALPPDPGLQAWAAAHRETRVVSLAIPGVQPAANLTVIAPEGIHYDQLGFALGYLAAMVTPEYRVGAVVLDPSAANLALARGFVAGGTYYCGLCRPFHPPYVGYPAMLEAVPANLPAAGLSTILVAPQPTSLAALGLPANTKTTFVGIGEPAADLSAVWIASAGFDIAPALETAWTEATTGSAGSTIPLAIRYSSLNESVVSEGRLRLAEAMLADLTAGLIDTGVDPLTGEPR